jgi:GTPase SAR1 family protein
MQMATPGPDAPAEAMAGDLKPRTKSLPTVVIVIGMAGSGKTSLMSRLHAECRMRGTPAYHVNLDPAVLHLPYTCNIDIRDTVDYRKVMQEYGLGPNGAIVTALNLFASRFDQVMTLLQQRAPEVEYIFVDTPGQIEVFTWSASGSIITDMLASTFPTAITYVVDTPRTQSPVTFMSNMLYACSIMFKTRLPFIIAMNKVDITPGDFAVGWMEDFERFQLALDNESDKPEGSYIHSLTRSLSLTLDEFYSTLRAVLLSAATGEGIPALFVALHEAEAEYEECYVPELLAAAAERTTITTAATQSAIVAVSREMEEHS